MAEIIIGNIFEFCILPLLTVLTAALVSWIKSKKQEAVAKTDNEVIQKNLHIITDIISDCVTTTTETYVKSLKAQGEFTAEAQKKALNDTKEAVLNMLTDEAKQSLTAVIGDLESYVVNKIETMVKIQK